MKNIDLDPRIEFNLETPLLKISKQINYQIYQKYYFDLLLQR